MFSPDPDHCDDCGRTGPSDTFFVCPWRGCSHTMCDYCRKRAEHYDNICPDCARDLDAPPDASEIPRVSILQMESDARRHPYHLRHKPGLVQSRYAAVKTLLWWALLGSLVWIFGWLLAVEVTS